MCECVFCDTCVKTGKIMVGKYGPQNLGTMGDHMASNQLNKLLGIEVLL